MMRRLSDYCLLDHTRRPPGTELSWKDILTHLHMGPLFVLDPRVHFNGLRGTAWRSLGVTRNPKNPNFCNQCAIHWDTGRLSEVTVLFADVRGFTTLMHERGPEFVAPLVDQLLRRCSEIVFDQEGIVDRFMGDAVMAYFNLPIKLEDHVDRAVSAAAQMQLAARHIEAPETSERPLRLGIGIHTGYAFAGAVGSSNCGDYTVLGDVVNIASRLQSQAAPGEVLVSDDVYQQVRDAFPNAGERVLELKGIAEPVRAFSLT